MIVSSSEEVGSLLLTDKVGAVLAVVADETPSPCKPDSYPVTLSTVSSTTAAAAAGRRLSDTEFCGLKYQSDTLMESGQDPDFGRRARSSS